MLQHDVIAVATRAVTAEEAHSSRHRGPHRRNNVVFQTDVNAPGMVRLDETGERPLCGPNKGIARDDVDRERKLGGCWRLCLSWSEDLLWKELVERGGKVVGALPGLLLTGSPAVCRRVKHRR